jgi:cobyrinic acid a,c-diamide synthase
MMPLRSVPRIVIAAAASSAGKTTIAAGLIAALRRQGLAVQPFKCGPDYIDPSYHERAAGRPCRNLDAWMLDDAQLLEGFSRACRDADIAVIEGVMGLFDGSNWHDERASTAYIAKLLDAPVLLVVDIAGAARSAAAVVLGCQHFDPELTLRGVVLNFAGSEGHAMGCAEAITAKTGVPMLGWLPRDSTLEIPERHLGLVPGGEHLDSNILIAAIADAVGKRFDLAAITDIARSAAAMPRCSAAEPAGDTQVPTAADAARGDMQDVQAAADTARGELDVGSASSSTRRTTRPPVIAVARDAAFCFYYPENLELLSDAGAQIEFFSPLHGERPHPSAAGVYLGGGYPELHAAALTSNQGLWDALKDLRAQDAPIYAECGGFMALTQGLIDGEGRLWPMAGLVPGVARMTEKLAALGYRHATALRANLLTDVGEVLRGHEFRYSNWSCDGPIAGQTLAWQVRGTRANAPADSGGFVSGNLLASYLHIHFAQRAGLANRFVARCTDFISGAWRNRQP